MYRENMLARLNKATNLTWNHINVGEKHIFTTHDFRYVVDGNSAQFTHKTPATGEISLSFSGVEFEFFWLIYNRATDSETYKKMMNICNEYKMLRDMLEKEVGISKFTQPQDVVGEIVGKIKYSEEPSQS